MRVVKILGVLLVLLTFFGCTNEKADYDKAPDWLRGNAYKFMQDRGNFTYFLQAIDLSGYKDLVNGKGLCTVFAPDDDAFSAWMKENNYSSLEEVNPEELKLLVGYHLVAQSFSKDMLLNFQQKHTMGMEDTKQGEAYKYKTYAKAQPVEMFNKSLQTDVKVYQREKYLPVISSRLFQTQECSDPEKTYKYFFPDVNWMGTNDQLYVANAAVKEAGLPTDNGYVYVLDKVVTPRQTLYDALKNEKEGQFSIFLELFDRFQNFVYDKTISTDYAAPGEKYYLFYHNAAPKTANDLPELASEWSYHGEEDAARASYVRYLRDCYNCFAFNNEAFTRYFNEYFYGYSDYKDLPLLTLYYLLIAHAVDHRTISLPDQIERQGVIGQFGEEWPMSRDENIIYREFCANGLLYGINKVLSPRIFEGVTKPLFQDSKYSITAYMYDLANEYNILVDTISDHYTVFLVSDDTLNQKYGYQINQGNVDLFGDEYLQIREDGKLTDYKRGSAFVQTEVNNAIISGAIRDFQERKYYATQNTFTYIYVENDSVYGGNGVGIPILSEDVIETKNGLVYEIADRLVNSEQSVAEVLTGEPRYTKFYKALQAANLVKIDGEKITIPFITNDRVMVFVPEEETLDNLPADPDELANYLKYFFVSTNSNKLTDYVLPELGTPGVFYTLAEDVELSTAAKKVYEPLTINFVDNKRLELVNKTGTQRVETNGEVPEFLTDGIIYRLTQPISVK